MRKLSVLILLLYSSIVLGQETTIRVLGVYPSHLSLSSSSMTTHLQGIPTAWNNSGLPAGAVTTVQLLNNAVAVPVAYAGLPSTIVSTAGSAYQEASLQALRHAWQADVLVLFTNHTDRCGATAVQWTNGNFVPDGQGLDLRFRHQSFIPVVNPNCAPFVTPHEFGHLLGGGHYLTGPGSGGLYSDSRAWVTLYFIPEWYLFLADGTAISDTSDVSPDYSLYQMPHYSRNESGYGDGDHENVRTLITTARSVANFYEYPNVPPVLNPPINLYGVYLGCVDYWTRHDLFWSNDPATNVPITAYEVWKSQPIGYPFVYGWTTYGAYTPSYVIGATGRVRVNACSGGNCSALSLSYYDAEPYCGF